MKTFGSVVFALAFSLASSPCLAGERKLEIATAEYSPYYGKDLESGGVMTEIVVKALTRAGTNAQSLDSSGPESITVAHWVTVNRNKPTNEIVLDEPPMGFEAYEHGAIYKERGPRTFYCSHSLDPCRAWSEFGKTDTPPNKR